MEKLYVIYKVSFEGDEVVLHLITGATEIETVYELIKTEKFEVDYELYYELYIEYDIVELTLLKTKKNYKMEHLDNEYLVISEKIFVE